jgi:predicted Fe-Mo cluster-binding NifX family protein
MKIAVSAAGKNLDSPVDPRFGRCQYFIIIDTETMSFEAIPNMSADSMSGAGIQAAQEIASRGVEAIVTGSVGPNAYQVLSSAGIRILIGASGTVREAVEMFKRGQLQDATIPGSPRFGAGSGRGRGFGTGMGRGMGRFFPQPYQQAPVSRQAQATPMSREEEILMLERQMGFLQQQLDQIKKRLKELKDVGQESSESE